MRPIHGLFLVAAVALVLIGALVFWTGGDDSHGPGGSDPAQRAAPEKVAAAPVDLTDAPDDGNDRSVTTVPASSASRPDAAAPSGPARRLGGRVVDDAGRPVAGATVYAASGGGFDDLALDEYEPRDGWLQRVDTKTDADGRFAVEPRAQSQVRFAVRASGYAPLDVERTISEAKLDVGDLVVQTGVVLEGRVVDHLGRAVEGAELRRRRTSSGPLVMFAGRGGAVAAKTDAQGAFRVDCLGSGAWSLRVTSEIAPDKDESGETSRPGERVRGLVFQLEEGFEISGVVRGVPAGEAAALRVSASPARGDGGEFAMVSGAGLGGRNASIAANGSFVVRGCRKEGKYRVSVRLASDGLGAMLRGPARSPVVDATAGERGVELAYRAETALTFQVVDDATGAPIASMSVSAGKGFAMPLLDEKNRSVRNFPEGRVRYGGLRLSGGPMMRPNGGGSASTGITLRIESAGYAPYERDDIQVTEGSDTDLGVIRLARTSVVEVHVTSKASGAPVAGALVTLERVEKDNAPGRMFSIRASGPAGGDDDDEGIRFGGGGDAHRGRTGADGVVRVSSLPGQTGRIVVRHKEFAELRSEPIDLPREQDVVQSVVLSAGGTIVVHVVDAEGDPVVNEGIEHRVPGEDGEPMFMGPNSLASDAEGLATLRRESAGVHRFRLARNSNGPRMIGGGGMRMAMSRRIEGGGPSEPEAPWVEVVVAEGGTHEVMLVAPERARVVGRVREGGRALSGATVRLRTKDGTDMPFFDDGEKAETDGQGEFALENVGVGEYVLAVSHPSRVMAHELDLRVGSGETRKDVELPLSIIDGRVTDEKGNGIAGLRVRAERQSGNEGVERQVMVALDSGDGPITFGGGGGGQVTTDAEGRYKLRGVLAETDLTIVASGQGVQRTSSEVVRVPVDGSRSDVDLVVKKGATLEVTCRRPDGSPASPCEVRAELQAEGDADTKFEITRGDGKARFQGLKPGRWRVIARDLGPPSDAGEPAPSEQMVDVEVGPPVQVTLEVRGT